jgi:hypothetical protein
LLSLPPWLGIAVTVIVCGSALWKGAWEERMTAAGLIVNFAISIFLRDATWPNVQVAGFAVDIATLVLLLGIALRTHKYWPMAAAAFQLLGVMTHVAKLIDPLINHWTYLSAIIIWTYLILIALGIGTWNAWRARRQLAKAPAEAGATRR